MPAEEYSKKVLQIFRRPKNIGRIKNADGVGKVGNVVCGDVMYLYLKIKPDEKGREIIQDAKVETFGCVAAIATSSLLTEKIIGKSIEEALKIKASEIAEELGGLPKIKMHCSFLALDALAEAIYDYLRRHKKPIPKELEKKHQAIQKKQKILEERYKEWLK
ncbi:iron-sulfur cluster assembly scaffold protein [bacterium]|nr:iron-sulfur cluster assembly scaffold protein [bacterium]